MWYFTFEEAAGVAPTAIGHARLTEEVLMALARVMPSKPGPI
jgi:hypothetical protein